MNLKTIFIISVLMFTVFAGQGNQNQQGQISDTFCDANTPCPDTMECASFPEKGLRCYSGNNPCALANCAEDEECMIAEMYPPSIYCSKESTGNGGTDTIQYDVQTGEVTIIKNKIRNKIQNKLQEMTQQVEGYEGIKKEVMQVKNQVRESVHYFLAFPEEITEKNLGQQISEIAKQFNNSVQAQINAEERVRKRDGILRSLFGADEKAVEELEQEQEELETQIEEMEQIKEQLTENEQEFVEEELDIMKQEQNRIKELVQKEKKDKGILGWIFK